MSLLELFDDVIKYAFIEDRLLEALRMKSWRVVKMSNLEYYIANINPQYKKKNAKKPIQLHLTNPMSLHSQRKPSGGWISLIAYSTYKIIHEKYDGLLSGHDNVNVICKFPPRRVSPYVHALFSHQEFYLRHLTPFLRKVSQHDDMLIWEKKWKKL